MSTYRTLIDKIHHKINPYQGYEQISGSWPAEHFGGWGSDHPWLGELIAALKPGLVIEVGSFLGGSAIRMGESLRAQGLKDSAILCVDTWLAEDILWSMPEHRARLKITFGTPCFYYTFLSNIMDKGLQDVVVPLRMPSLSAGRYLRRLGITAPLIYIDGCHEEGDVRNDLEMYWDRLEPGGVMLIDDYEPAVPMFAGLARDVQKFAKARKLKPEILGNKVKLKKPA